MTCVEYINHYRLSRAAAALAQSDQPVMEAALENGFHNISYFNKLFRKEIRHDAEGIQEGRQENRENIKRYRLIQINVLE